MILISWRIFLSSSFFNSQELQRRNEVVISKVQPQVTLFLKYLEGLVCLCLVPEDNKTLALELSIWLRDAVDFLHLKEILKE